MKLIRTVYFLLIFLFSFSIETDLDSHLHVECGGETISGNQFQEGNQRLDNAKCRTTLYSRSGSHCFMLNKVQQFGPSLRIDSIKQGDVVYAAVYRKRESAFGHLVIASKDELQYESNHISTEEKGDWELIKSSFVAKQDYDYVTVYLWNPLKEVAYFDDLSIDCFRNNKKPESVAEKDILRIEIPQSALDSIIEYRDQALRQEVITSDLKTYFKAAINIDDTHVPVALRLKGDWVDHLEGEKWSLRIKFKGSNAYQGMKKFSIQDPHTRSFMMEWFGHKLFEKEDILTTRYQYKVVYINGVNKGVYALEEHFDKRLLEHRKRREGPIVKFDESGVWQGYYDQQKYQRGFKKFPYLESAEILPFSKKRTRKNPVLLNQFILAQSHMSRFRNLDTAFHEYLDVDKMARFIALCDVMNATHGLIWHNQRNYLNPINGILEPVAYDCFSGQLSIHYDLLGEVSRSHEENDFTSFDALFLNQEFNRLYIEYLKRFSSEDYIKDSFLEFEKEIRYYEGLIKHEYPLYYLNKEYFLLNQCNVREKVNKYENQPIVNRNISKKERYMNTAQNVVFDEVALKVYTVESDSSSGIFQFENYLLSPIEIIGYSTKLNKNLIFPFDQKIELAAFLDNADKKTQGFSFKPRRVYYKTRFTGDSLHSIKVSPLPPVVSKSIMNFETSKISKAFYQDADELRFKANGIYNFNKTVYIPINKKLVVEEGVQLKLSNGARFVCYGPVQMLGVEDNPIRIDGIGVKGGGVVFFPNKDSVEMSHVICNNLTDANTNTWTLTGGITIYEGQVGLSNCSFMNARSEDALNLIRCNFEIDGILIDKTYSDGFDADFCNGQLKNSVFKSTGNDCIDFSGSQIDIEACKIFDSGDKGISGGEHSILTVRNCIINGAAIGVASKDNSFIKVQRTSLESCDFAFAAYQKKAEFGSAKIDVESSNLKNIQNTYLIERDSEIKHLGKINIGTEMFNIDSMYQEYSKAGN